MFARRYRVLPSEEKTWNKNLAAVSSLSERCPGKVSFMLVPSASTVYPEKLPLAAPQMDEEARINEAAHVVQGGHFINVLPALYDHKDEYLYYRTDHHWTTLGAYYAYEAFCKELGLTPFDRSTHTVETAEDFYGTHYSKARTWNAEPDTITWYDLQNKLTIWNVTGPGQPTDGTETGLYDTAKLDVYDKYAMFLHGNNGLYHLVSSLILLHHTVSCNGFCEKPSKIGKSHENGHHSLWKSSATSRFSARDTRTVEVRVAGEARIAVQH